MIEKDGKIVEATVGELYERYLRQELENIMTFPEYRSQMERAGCKVREGCDVKKTAVSA